MDSMGAILEGDWSCLSGMYSTEQEADFMSQLLRNCPVPDDELRVASFFWPADHANVDMTTTMAATSYCSSMDFCMEDGTNTSSFLVEADGCLNVEKGDEKIEELVVPYKSLELRRETEMPKLEPVITEKKSNDASDNSKKRTQSSGDVQKTKRNARSKMNANNDEEGNAGVYGQSRASCSSEDDSNASQELKREAALNLKGKTRASRGAATDPQSLYARKRRERINERLMILQNLVPNGTKVDISTMLEEAVEYVKFLQLQIKLLSSDDHWMYAPIAYNGMDIGLGLLPKRW